MVSLALKAYSLILLVTLLDSSIAQGEGGGGAGGECSFDIMNHRAPLILTDSRGTIVCKLTSL